MTKKVKVLITILFISLMLLTTSSYAAIEIKEGASPLLDETLSNAFAICYNLRANSSTLGNNSLDPHLSLNSDWGIIAYLGASTYGCRGVTSTIATSTSGNESGVKDLGKTGSLCSVSAKAPEDWWYSSNVVNNRNTKYVELGWSEYGKRGTATGETQGWLGCTYPKISTAGNYDSSNLIVWRIGVFGFNYAQHNVQSYVQRPSGVTFRPVIWN